jgi:hypothetical protein
VWPEGDILAAEPHVLAELSKDKALLELYGPNANPNHDRYLFTLAGIPSPHFDPVRAVYDRDNPTKESVKKAKAECKKLRGLGKVLCVGENTHVRVKDLGWVPIQDVKDNHQIWDGEEWVRSDGPLLTKVDSGESAIILEGVTLTRDHLVLTTEGWNKANEVLQGDSTAQLVRPKLPSASWSEVWAMGSSIARDAAEVWVSLCSRLLSSCFRALGSIRQLKVR